MGEVMSKHTPGPWRFAWIDNDDLQMSFASVVIGEHVFSVGHGHEREASARLIAAAPDLLEALEFALHYIPVEDAEGMWKARAAIAKAKGE